MEGLRKIVTCFAFWGLATGGLRAAETHKATLDGYREVPAVSTTGEGSLVLKVANNEASMDYTLTYSNLEGATTLAAHIHLGQKDVNGAVSAFLCGGPTPPCPPTGGTVSGTITATDVIGPTSQGIAPGELAELLRAIRTGNTYANVHTASHPGGEIRGQIHPGGGQ